MPIEKRWVVKPQGDPATVEALASALRIPPVLANLLVQRGIDTEEKAHSFFNPTESCWIDGKTCGMTLVPCPHSPTIQKHASCRMNPL